MKPNKKLNFPVVETIAKRWSPRAFSDKKIPVSEIRSLFEAARWAASSRNDQPWTFIWANKDNTEMHKILMDCLGEWNQSWAQSADVLILGMVKTVTGKKNYPHPNAMYDLGLAVGNLTTQATENGIYLHQMGGFEPEIIKKHFRHPDHYQPIVMIAAGYPGELSRIPNDIAEIEHDEQTRKDQDEFVFDSFPIWE